MAPLLITLLILTLINYDSIVLSVLVHYPDLSAHLPDSCLVVPFLVANQGMHHGTYIATHLVGHKASKSHQINGVLLP